jgi:hypothetical protein
VLLSIMRTKLLVLALVTVAGVMILLLASMPRLRWWTRRTTPQLAPAVAGPVPRPAAAVLPDGRPDGPAGPVPARPGPAGPESSWPGQPAEHPWPAGPGERRPSPPPAGGDGEESTLIQRRSR